MDDIRPQLSRARGVAQMTCAALLAAVLGCSAPDAAARGRTDSSGSDRERQPGYIIDSILPPAEALRRFRANLERPRTLDGASSRDALVQLFFRALSAADRVALDSLVVNRAEFAYLVYPESDLARAPYAQPPEIAWLLLRSSSDAGATRLVRRSTLGEPLSYQCGREERQGRMRLWRDCLVRSRLDGRVRDVRLFGAIIELDGRYKFAGYDNDL